MRANMSTQTVKTNQSNSVYSIYQQNVQKYFESISKNTPQFFQATTHFQEECMKAGGLDFIRVPFEPKNVIPRIKKFCYPSTQGYCKTGS